MNGWIDEDEREHAEQLAMLEIDERSGAAWLQTMRDLIGERLPHKEFTDRRMAALKAWEKRRKLDQVQLHYNYDPSRRNPRLVRREIDKQLAKVGAQLQRLTPIVEALRDDSSDHFRDAPKLVDVGSGSKRQIEDVEPAFTRPLEGIDPTAIQMIAGDTGLDVGHATNDEILQQYIANGLTPDEAAEYVTWLESATP